MMSDVQCAEKKICDSGFLVGVYPGVIGGLWRVWRA